MDTNAPVVVYSTTNPAEAAVIKNVLLAEGIKCEVAGENQAGLLGLVSVDVVVRAWDEDRARHILATHSQQHLGHRVKQEGD